MTQPEQSPEDGTPSEELPHGTWSEAVAPIVRKFEVAAAMNMQACWNATGARATGALMKEMASRLDNEAVEAIRVRDAAIKELTERNAKLTQIGLDAADTVRSLEQERLKLRRAIAELGGNPDAAGSR